VADRAFAAAGLDRQVPFEVADYGSVAGLGIAFIPASAAGELAGLRVIEVADSALTWRVSIATPAARRLSAAARAFLAVLATGAGGTAAESVDIEGTDTGDAATGDG
jgi:DNA-binding transcriptional LysR family regulator